MGRVMRSRITSESLWACFHWPEFMAASIARRGARHFSRSWVTSNSLLE